jgi:hypothetical protein
MRPWKRDFHLKLDSLDLEHRQGISSLRLTSLYLCARIVYSHWNQVLSLMFTLNAERLAP